MVWEMPAAAENVSLCRRAVRLMLEHNLIEDSDIDDAELVLGELCSNVVRHAYGTQLGAISVRVELDDLEVLMSVKDTGMGFNINSRSAAPVFSENGGIGIFLMERLTDHLRISAECFEGSEVTASRHIAKRQPAH
jgi:anti-sigma regulatory factor (Ser/Thr protein kinase)